MTGGEARSWSHRNKAPLYRLCQKCASSQFSEVDEYPRTLGRTGAMRCEAKSVLFSSI